jgi:hypothetical protein
MVTSANNKRYLKYNDKYLYLKIDKQVLKLGSITTLKGKLTRAQKLRAVARTGEWVEI